MYIYIYIHTQNPKCSTSGRQVATLGCLFGLGEESRSEAKFLPSHRSSMLDIIAAIAYDIVQHNIIFKFNNYIIIDIIMTAHNTV